jgi:uncharacterized protein (DUF58 family)
MRPSARGVGLISASFPLALGCAVLSTQLWPVWLAYLGVCLLLLGADAVLGLRVRDLQLVAEVPGMIYLGDQAGVAHLTLRAPTPARLELSAELADELAVQPLKVLDLRERASVDVPLSPRRRGRFAVHALHARWSGPLGLLRRQTRLAIDRQIDVLPDIRAVRATALRFFSSPQALAGLKVERFLGDGSEFESLREYVPGLDHRAIDWKSTARRRKLLVQDFRAERNHQVVIAIDTGHLMSEPIAGLPKLDHAIRAGLLLAYIGLRTGDRVGLCGFDARLRAFHEPVAGVSAFPRLQKASAELAYSTEETNFTLGLTELGTRLPRRSLVVLLTDFVDVVSAELMLDNLTRLARRHMVVFVSLRDIGLAALSERQPESSLDLYRQVIAHDMLREREIVLRRLRRLGLRTIDAAPAEISAELVSSYLDIKRRELV